MTPKFETISPSELNTPLELELGLKVKKLELRITLLQREITNLHKRLDKSEVKIHRRKGR
jgi:uncharacterized small protein (DUF1192 family)